jgi:hypothetical protein
LSAFASEWSDDVRLIVLASFILAQVLILGRPTATEAATCHFVLGFQTLHNLIPSIVGDCLEEEHHNPANGDGLQATTGKNGAGGLLVWRKADNFTAFTDGYRTWVNGPFGLQMRLNTERFPWEALTLEQLKNATYAVEEAPNHLAPLVNGKFSASIVPGSATKVSVTLLDSTAAFGDLHGNGSQDAAVVLAVNAGGTGTFNYLEAVVNVLGTPTNVASQFLGDRVKINSVSITNGTIVVDMVTAGPGDALCCPTLHVVQTYQLQGAQLVKLS